MKKAMVILLVLVLLLTAGVSMAESGAEASFDFSDLEGLTFWYTSGVGGWHVSMKINADGSFSGDYIDSEMGDSAEDYPNGSVYGSLFHGVLQLGERKTPYSYAATITEFSLDEGQLDTHIEDGIRYITCAPYGLGAFYELELYLPGMPVSELPEGYYSWCLPIRFAKTESDTLPVYGLYNAIDDVGFFSEEDYAAE